MGVCLKLNGLRAVLRYHWRWKGEGETWEEKLGFSLSDDGSELTQTHLIEVEGNPPPPVKIPPPLTRKKCPQ